MSLIKVSTVQGKSLIYNDEVIYGEGSEANVYKPNSNAFFNSEKYLFKIFKKKDEESIFDFNKRIDEKEKKLCYMIMHCPEGTIQNPIENENNVFFTWPVELLYCNNKFCGYIMPRVKSMLSLTDMFSKSRRNRVGLGDMDLSQKYSVARQLVCAVKKLHEVNIYGLDGNTDNYLVSEDGAITLIDVDAFEVYDKRSNIIYKGDSWFESVASPEQLLAFDEDRNVPLSKKSDAYICAMIVFKILMDGVSPFVGVPRLGYDATLFGKGPDATKYRQLKGYYVYGTHSREISPKPSAPNYKVCVTDSIHKLFVECFENGCENINYRPSVERWFYEMDREFYRIINGEVENSLSNNVNERGKINPMLFLLDVTPSMRNQTRAWGPLNNSFKYLMKCFKDKSCKFDFDLATVDIAVMEFANSVNISQPFVQLNKIINRYMDSDEELFKLQLANTNLEKALYCAIEYILKYEEKADLNSEEYRRPKIFLLTDGIPTENMRERFSNREEFYEYVRTYNKKDVEIICVALGELCDKGEILEQDEFLKAISSNGDYIRITGEEIATDLQKYMEWVSMSTIRRKK